MADHCHNTPGTHGKTRKYVAGVPAGTRDRLALFAEWTGTAPFPADKILEGSKDERTFTDAFLRHCNDTGMSIDWVWLNDEKGLVIAAHHAAKGGAA
ncbi:hypothetical protein [Paracoccus beibuensis]|uniref:hypothetical protein n=1 Tax=Paracoccus beibuensis TaxID=547602 RepID=UPI00223ED304|nr:hypothetical protein [Paracoccus beibuensis]